MLEEAGAAAPQVPVTAALDVAAQYLQSPVAVGLATVAAFLALGISWWTFRRTERQARRRLTIELLRDSLRHTQRLREELPPQLMRRLIFAKWLGYEDHPMLAAYVAYLDECEMLGVAWQSQLLDNEVLRLADLNRGFDYPLVATVLPMMEDQLEIEESGAAYLKLAKWQFDNLPEESQARAWERLRAGGERARFEIAADEVSGRALPFPVDLAGGTADE